MSAEIDSDAIAQKHGLEGSDLEFFHRYLAAHFGEMASAAVAKAANVAKEQKRLEREAGGYAADIWEMNHEIPVNVRPALAEYFTLELDALTG